MDPYTVLGVQRTASEEDIAKAYRKLVSQYHPDKPGGDEKKFKEVQNAFEAIKNPRRSSSVHDMNMGDIFSGLFRRPTVDLNLHVVVTLTLEQILKPQQLKVKVPKKDFCTKCGCFNCGGLGIVAQSPFAGMRVNAPCPNCGGRGRSQSCTACGSTGFIAAGEQEMEITVPAGVENGQLQKYNGRGLSTNTFSGHLYVQFHIEDDPRYERDAADLYTKLRVTYSELVLGSKTDIETLHGAVTVKIPKGVSPGRKICLKKYGLPRIHNPDSLGDLFVVLELYVPTTVNAEHKAMLEKLLELERQDGKNS